MASIDSRQTQPLEEKISQLGLEDHPLDAGDSVKELLTASDGVRQEGSEDQAPGVDSNMTMQAQASQPDNQVDLATKEVEKSPDEGAYAVETIDHRSVAEAHGEEKQKDLPTAVVHENADTVVKNEAATHQNKGIIQSVTGKISQSVKSVFSGLTGSKSAKVLNGKSDDVKS